MLAGGDSLRVDGTSALAPRALEPNPLATPEPGPAPRFKPYSGRSAAAQPFAFCLAGGGSPLWSLDRGSGAKNFDR